MRAFLASLAAVAIIALLACESRETKLRRLDALLSQSPNGDLADDDVALLREMISQGTKQRILDWCGTHFSNVTACHTIYHTLWDALDADAYRTYAARLCRSSADSDAEFWIRKQPQGCSPMLRTIIGSSDLVSAVTRIDRSHLNVSVLATLLLQQKNHIHDLVGSDLPNSVVDETLNEFEARGQAPVAVLQDIPSELHLSDRVFLVLSGAAKNRFLLLPCGWSGTCGRIARRVLTSLRENETVPCYSGNSFGARFGCTHGIRLVLKLTYTKGNQVLGASTFMGETAAQVNYRTLGPLGVPSQSDVRESALDQLNATLSKATFELPF